MTPFELPPIREVIRRHGLKARKSLGQHFLLDPNLTARIAGVAGTLKDYNVIEIGAGPGGLTRALLNSSANKIFAVEKDDRCLAILDDLKSAYGERLQIIPGDALALDLPAIVPMPRKIVANLPYNIGTPLLLRWLRELHAYDGLTLTFQSEVAERLAAQQRSKSYGRLSVITQWLCEVKIAFVISNTAFSPSPKVASTVSNLIPRPLPLGQASFESMEALTAVAFGQRRKMLRVSLKSLNIDFNSLRIDPTARAEELSVMDFCALANAIEKK